MKAGDAVHQVPAVPCPLWGDPTATPAPRTQPAGQQFKCLRPFCTQHVVLLGEGAFLQQRNCIRAKAVLFLCGLCSDEACLGGAELSVGCPLSSMLAVFLLPGSALTWQSLVPLSRRACPYRSLGGRGPGRGSPAGQRAPVLSEAEFMSFWCLPSAESVSGKCGLEIFPQLPGCAVSALVHFGPAQRPGGLRSCCWLQRGCWIPAQAAAC